MGVATYLALAIGIASLAAIEVNRYLIRTRGLEDGLASSLPYLVVPRFGVNVSLEHYTDQESLREALDVARSTGFGSIRQRFSWAEMEPVRGQYRWEPWDQLLPIVDETGLQVIAVLDTSPSWARRPWESDNPWAPPSLAADYARFAEAFARRYGHLVMAYQIWDQPNITPHWGKGPIDPAGYVELLRLSSEAIRSADPAARIIAGGLAPNLESGGRNMSDLLFLREIYRRGAGPYFDVLGAKPYGFWSGPDDRRVHAKVLNFSRVILLREEMVRRGEAHKPIWALESGWCALPADWQGSPSPQGSDDPGVQADRLDAAVLRVQQEWPWMGLMCISHLQPDADLDDPIWGYALLAPDGQPRSALERLRTRLGGQPVVYPGFTADLSRYVKPLERTNQAELHFWGTDLLLVVEKGVARGQLVVWLEDQPRLTTIDLGADVPRTDKVSVGRRLPSGTHKVLLQGTAEQIAALRGLQVGHRPRPGALWATIVVGSLGLGWCLLRASRAARKVPWSQGWQWASQHWLVLPPWAQWGAMVAPLLALVLVPSTALRLACLAFYGVCALLRPHLALLVAVASIPFAPLHVDLGIGSFSPTEITLLAAVAARLWNALLSSPSGLRLRVPLSSIVHLHLLDWAVLLLVLLAFGTSWAAEYRRVAFRELRVVVCESALLYLLLRTAPGGRAHLLRLAPLHYGVLADALWLSAVSVAVYALARYPFAGGVIEAEGARRARAFFGSPNNLALYMERVLPLGLAVGLWGRTSRRRWLYGLGAIPVALALVMTFSRGALFLGVPASLLVLALMAGRRTGWILGASAAAFIVAMTLLGGVGRLSSLLDPSQGTTFLRLSLWRAAWEMVQDHPWLGVGLDNFLYYYGDYLRPGAEVDRWLSHPHNLVLDFWLRLGIGGVIALVALLAGFLKRSLTAWRSSPEGDYRAMTLGFIAGVATFVAHGAVDSSYFTVELAYWFMFALAWVAHVGEEHHT